ncbi:hypothetical protein J2X68_007551 [Streptomyces sp. 3330]|nr:hypothetical protein [Streptomyces sp. 3330]
MHASQHNRLIPTTCRPLSINLTGINSPALGHHRSLRYPTVT